VTGARPRSWYVDVDEIALDDEIAFLKTEIYLRDVEPRLQTLTAFTRFQSGRRAGVPRPEHILGKAGLIVWLDVYKLPATTSCSLGLHDNRPIHHWPDHVITEFENEAA
jgi:hypothetical protein